MRKYIILLIFSICLSACFSNREKFVLSKFSYNNKFRNSLIVDRVPDYGDGHSEGCIVMGEMYLSLTSSSHVETLGEIYDAKTLEPLSGAILKVYLKNQEAPIKINSDMHGKFKLIKQSEILKMESSYIGYRDLSIDLSRSKLLTKF